MGAGEQALKSGGEEEGGGLDGGMDQEPFKANVSPKWKQHRDKGKPRKRRLTRVQADGAGAGRRRPHPSTPQ